MLISYRPDHGTRGEKGNTTGRLHNDTAYGIIKFAGEGSASTVVHRRNLTDFKKRDHLISGKVRIRDERLRDALLVLWDHVESKGGKAADFARLAATEGVLLNGNRQKVRTVRVVEQLTIVPIKRNPDDSTEKPYKGYKTDGNEFVDIWKMRDGNWKIEVVNTFDANQPGFETKRPVTSWGKHKGKPDPAAKWLMRLHKNDLGALHEGSSRRIVRVRKFDARAVVLDDYNEANVDRRERAKEIKRNNGHSVKALREEGFRKVHVDELGRVRDRGPFKQ